MKGLLAAIVFAASVSGAASAAKAPVEIAILGPDFARNGHDDGIVECADAALHRAPHALAEIHIEGVSAGLTRAPGVAVPQINPNFGVAASRAALQDMNVMRDLALAWRLTGRRGYLRQAGRYLDAWSSTYRISFNPVDEGSFDAMILTYDLTEANLPHSTRTRVDAFLRRLAAGYIEAMESGNVPIKPTLTNNWQSHRIKLATLAAFQIGDRDLQRRAHILFDKQLSANLRADGSTLDFAQRDALHYVTFSLDSMLMAAMAAKMHGQNWYTTEVAGGSSLPNTLAWLGRFASGQATHVEFAKSVVFYDRQRAASGNATYQNKPWDPQTARRTYLLAAQLDPHFVPLRDSLLASAHQAHDHEVEPGDDIDWLLLFADGPKAGA